MLTHAFLNMFIYILLVKIQRKGTSFLPEFSKSSTPWEGEGPIPQVNPHNHYAGCRDTPLPHKLLFNPFNPHLFLYQFGNNACS